MSKVPFKAFRNGQSVVVGETELDTDGNIVNSVIHDTEVAKELGFTPGMLDLDGFKKSQD